MPVKEYRFRDVVLGKEIVLPAGQAQDFVIRKADGMPTYHFAVVVDDAEMSITQCSAARNTCRTPSTTSRCRRRSAIPRPIYGHLPIIHEHRRQQDGKARPRQENSRPASSSGSRTPTDSAEKLAEAGTALPVARIAAWLKDTSSSSICSEQSA